MAGRGKGIKNTEQDILDRISPEPNSGCWLWTGTLDHYGYGAVQFDGKLRKAHQVVYRMHGGEIPEGTELDHKCRVTCCVNPDHLEPVTHGENMRRGTRWQLKKTHCPRGHAYDIRVNNGMSRACSICRNDRVKAWKASRRAA